MTVTLETIDQTSARELARILEHAGTVDPVIAERELPLCARVAVARDNGAPIGLAAIKRDRPDYRARIESKAHASIPPSARELGYLAVSEDRQGKRIGLELLERVLRAYDGPLFVTTALSASRVFARHGFVQYGDSWQGSSSELRLYIRR